MRALADIADREPSRSTRIKVMADYYTHPLWAIDDDLYGDFPPEQLDLSPELARDLNAWADAFTSSLDPDEPGASRWSDVERRCARGDRPLARRATGAREARPQDLHSGSGSRRSSRDQGRRVDLDHDRFGPLVAPIVAPPIQVRRESVAQENPDRRTAYQATRSVAQESPDRRTAYQVRRRSVAQESPKPIIGLAKSRYAPAARTCGTDVAAGSFAAATAASRCATSSGSSPSVAAK